jgi:hypothetical protein
MERRNWWILGVLLAGSALLDPLRFTLGVAVGGALSILGFHTLEGAVARLLQMPAYRARARMVFFHYARLGFLAGVLALLLGSGAVDPVALLLGLSVVVLNMLFTVVRDMRKIQLEV